MWHWNISQYCCFNVISSNKCSLGEHKRLLSKTSLTQNFWTVVHAKKWNAWKQIMQMWKLSRENPLFWERAQLAPLCMSCDFPQQHYCLAVHYCSSVTFLYALGFVIQFASNIIYIEICKHEMYVYVQIYISFAYSYTACIYLHKLWTTICGNISTICVHLGSKPLAKIGSWLSFCWYNSTHSSWMNLDCIGTCLQGFAPIQTQAIGSGSQSAFKIIPKVFTGVQVWALCESSSSTPDSVNHFFMALGAQGYCHAGTEKGPP